MGVFDRMAQDSFVVVDVGNGELMQTYIFYTPEGRTFSPLQEEVENLQVLGFGQGENEEAALQQLLAEQTWILQMGFSAEAILSRRISD